MAKFIKLTRISGEQVYLNSDYIYKLIPADNVESVKSTIVHYCDGEDNDFYTVTESIDAILSQIEGKAYVK